MTRWRADRRQCPGAGTLLSSAFAATTPDMAAFRSARDHAAWRGPTPKARSSGGKAGLVRISKAGNRYLRRLLYLGAMATLTVAEMLILVGDDPTRIRSEAAFAKLCGVCPIPASSRKTHRFRLNRGGNRQAKAAL